ncbi:MAG TPA: 3-dehydroquinate synthase [Bacteroidota bacterium]|nr:3-dehydroquinate synthase [Bacteroidota bacterium]
MKNSSRRQVIRVPLGERTYPIYIGTKLLSGVGDLFHEHRLPPTAVVITDSRVATLYLGIVERSLVRSGFTVHSIVIPPGEKQKSLERANDIYTELLRKRIERRSTIVALGGGVVGDLSGFIAATYQRGVGFVQIPTTLLAQVDSSVGGKVGVNHPLGKNMVGAFYQPNLVVADVSTLQTLPEREIVCGLGEVVKYGAIMDRKFFGYSGRNLRALFAKDPAALKRVVSECCRMKAYVVSKDERESGFRAILNFGHTIGHALEKAGGYRRLKHGEAILLGMAAESFIALQSGLLKAADAALIEETILSVPLPRLKDLPASPARLIDAMRVDKKVAGSKIRFVLPTSVGRVLLPQPVETERILEGLGYLRGFIAALR